MYMMWGHQWPEVDAQHHPLNLRLWWNSLKVRKKGISLFGERSQIQIILTDNLWYELWKGFSVCSFSYFWFRTIQQSTNWFIIIININSNNLACCLSWFSSCGTPCFSLYTLSIHQAVRLTHGKVLKSHNTSALQLSVTLTENTPKRKTNFEML